MTKPMYELSGEYARLLDEIYESADEGGEITGTAGAGDTFADRLKGNTWPRDGF